MGITANVVRGMERSPKDVQVYGKCNQKCTCEIGKDSDMTGTVKRPPPGKSVADVWLGELAEIPLVKEHNFDCLEEYILSQKNNSGQKL